MALNFIPHVEAQFSKDLRSFSNLNWSGRERILRYSRQSSAKSLTWDDTTSGRSLIWIKNKSGPKTVPWGTPESTVTDDGNSPSTITHSLFVKNADNYFSKFPSIP